MIKQLIAGVVLLSVLGTADAGRVLEEVETSVEVALAGLTLPTSATGTITLRPCAQCPSSTHLLSNPTTFVLGTRELPLEEFLLAAETLRQNRAVSDTTLVTVFFARDNRRVTRLTLHAAQP